MIDLLRLKIDNMSFNRLKNMKLKNLEKMTNLYVEHKFYKAGLIC